MPGQVYYKEAVGALVVFDVTRTSSFDAVPKWKFDIDSKITLPDGSPIPVMLLANKCDMAKEGLVKNNSQMDKFCEDKGFCGWFETSAKEDINIDKACRFLVGKIMENDRNNPATEAVEDDRVDLHKDGGATAQKSGCCS